MTPQLGAKFVKLYLEGLMILTFDGQANLLEAAPLSKACHRLEGVIHRRRLNKGGTTGGWCKVDYDPFDRCNIQDFATGRIFIENEMAESNAYASLFKCCRMVGDELWGPFSSIPDFEDVFFGGAVTLKYDQLKPSLRILTGTFYSVLRPDHPPIHPHDHPARCAPIIMESYRVERDALVNLRKTTTPPIMENEINDRLGPARQSLGIRPYTAATFLKLAQTQSLVCQLERNGNAKPDEVLRIAHDQDYEIRIAIRNSPIATEHESKEADGDPIHTFHSLHFYDAVEQSVARRFILSDKCKQWKYLNRKTVALDITTGAGNPGCPIGRRLRRITG